MSTTTTFVATPDRTPRCRYVRRNGERCTAETVDGDAKVIQLCLKHMGRALELIAERQAAMKTTRRSA